MREIKFRAWDGKEMIAPYSVRNGFAMVIKECNRDDKILTDIDGKIYYSSWDVDVRTDYPLMQFTGEISDGGIDIYEGDIVSKKEMMIDEEDVIGVVEFLEGQYWISNGENSQPLFSETAQIEVRGNIHENPELLEAIA
jgi:uncharacterized phage protein (TIGR01671 family)